MPNKTTAEQKRTRRQQESDRRADWRTAVQEGRVVRFGDPGDAEVSFTAYPTHIEACRVVVACNDPKVRIAIYPRVRT